ncbi:hypothetical protein JG688_00006870, partial [Phytophthora aleatoria]
MEHPRRACTSRKRPSHDVTDGGSGRSDSDASWEVDSVDASVSSASVDDSCPSETSGSKTKFVSWEALHSYLDLYQKETFQVLRMRSTKSVAERNMQIKNAQNSSAEVIPDEWEVYAKTII